MQEMMVIKLADPQITSKLILDMYGNYGKTEDLI